VKLCRPSACLVGGPDLAQVSAQVETLLGRHSRVGQSGVVLRLARWADLQAKCVVVQEQVRSAECPHLNFDSNGGDDIVVLTGTAEILDDYPAVSGNPAWLEKYGETIDARFGSAAKFAERFSVPGGTAATAMRCMARSGGGSRSLLVGWLIGVLRWLAS
jgi:hypothetical protein